MQQRLTYAEARPLINSGDCIGVATRSASAAVVRGMQRVAGLRHAAITHTAMALWVGDRLYAVEMSTGGNVLRPLSQYAGYEMLISAPPWDADLSVLAEALRVATEQHIPYGFVDLVAIGLRLLPRRLVDTTRWGKDSGTDQVCSFFAARVYEHMGAELVGWPRRPCPAEVAEALQPRFVVVPD